MSTIKLTYGVLPTQEEYSKAFDEKCPDGLYGFINDKRIASAYLPKWPLWQELEKAVQEWESGGNGFLTRAEEAGDWASCVLQVLGFEWV